MGIHFDRKRAGLLVPAFALRRERDLGIGDTYAMHESIDFCADHGFGVLQLLPLNETGGDNSPYNAISSVALEPAYLTLEPEAVPGLTREILDAHLSSEQRHTLQQGPVRYAEIKPLKTQVLAAAFARFEQTDLTPETELAGELAAFIDAERDWLPAYTFFKLLLRENGGNEVWTDWPEEHRTLAAAENWLFQQPNKEELHRYREFCAYVQWVAFRQWRAVKTHASQRKVELMGDIPFGVNRFSADVWAHPELFHLDWSGGAPPEPFFKTDKFCEQWGQNWGIPLYDWEAHQAENFAWWRQRVGKLATCYHHFRIDHVLGFFRIYAFPWLPQDNEGYVDLSPEEARAKAGSRLPQFLPGPDEPEESAMTNCHHGEELLRIILEAADEMGVVAEDLGMVPVYVRPLLQEMQIPGFSIPIFERDWDGTGEFTPIENYVPINLTTYATHDHDPLRAYYEKLVAKLDHEGGKEAWEELGKLMRWLGWDDQQPPRAYTTQLHDELSRKLVATPCWLAVFMITDLLGTSQRFNQPGAASDSNWSERLDRALSAYAKDPTFAPRLNVVSDAIREHGRWPA